MARAKLVGVEEVTKDTGVVPQAIENRVHRQRDALLALTASSGLRGEALSTTLAHVTEVTAATLAVSRVSVWRFVDGGQSIECLDLFDAVRNLHESGMTMRATNYPRYFRAIAESDLVAANDAMADPRTAEFAEPYLRPLSIMSMLDVPIRLDAEVVGVVCHEQTHDRREWSDDEKAFAVAVSTLISLAIERAGRHQAESEVLVQGAALNATAHPVVITDADSIIVWTNEAFTTMTGYTAPEVKGRNVCQLINDGRFDAERNRHTLDSVHSGQAWRGEVWNRRKDGSLILFDQTVTPVKDASGRVTHFIAIKQDLTQQRSLEGQFLQAQKMEVVGRLAGGIAHDFNNLLTVINGTAELALGDLPGNHPTRRDLERIQESGARAAALTRQLLTFSRKQIVNRSPIGVAPLLEGFKSTLQRLIGEDISLEVRSSGGDSTVLADRGQLEQVILNLAVNARDAMPRGGKLVIDIADVELDESFAETHTKVRPGPHVRLTVTDTGHGMSDEVIAQIFEPFFTTKEPGKGTGLGLATVYAIVERSDGTIWVNSTVGAGTTFTIYLPRIAGAMAEISTAPPPSPAKTGETILVVEDDDDVRAVGVRILEAAGYTTLSAATAVDALHILTEGKRRIDLIITDVVLTGMGGRDLAIYASAVAPDTPVLFTSGHTDDLVIAHGVRENLVQFIGKPFSAAALGQKVREVLALARKDRGHVGISDRRS